MTEARTGAADEDWSWLDDDEGWVPPAVEDARPSVARIYDHLLGGKDNFEQDRQAAAALLRAVPGAAEAARANRRFLIRAVRQMAEAGISQFLDLGTGIPADPDVAEVARAVHPGARVACVDNDPIVLAHIRAMLADSRSVVAVLHDLREPGAVLADPAIRGLLDFTRPVGLLMTGVLHFVGLAVAPVVTSRYYRELVPGSRVAITAAARDGVPDDAVVQAEEVYATTSAPLVVRTHAQVEHLFDGMGLLPPGLEELYRTGDGSLLGGIGAK